MVVIFFFTCLSLVCTYVPWKVVVGSTNFVKVPSHYDWIWSDATAHLWGGRDWPIAGIDIDKLIAEIIALTAINGLLYFLFSDTKSRRR
jgi:hypothetical protein